jgi:hypothetical protein
MAEKAKIIAGQRKRLTAAQYVAGTAVVGSAYTPSTAIAPARSTLAHGVVSGRACTVQGTHVAPSKDVIERDRRTGKLVRRRLYAPGMPTDPIYSVALRGFGKEAVRLPITLLQTLYDTLQGDDTGLAALLDATMDTLIAHESRTKIRSYSSAVGTAPTADVAPAATADGDASAEDILGDAAEDSGDAEAQLAALEAERSRLQAKLKRR